MTEREGTGGGGWERAARLVLVFYPHRFRETLGEDMVSLFVAELERRRRRWRAGVVLWALGTLVAMIAGGVMDRFSVKSGWWHVWDTLAWGLRVSGRALVRSRSFSATAVATMALGVGASTAVFALAWGIWLKPLPYADPVSLVTVTDVSRSGSSTSNVSAPQLEDLRRIRAFAAVSGYVYAAGIATVDGEPVRVRAFRVEPSLFFLLGVRPALGRGFGESDRREADGPVVVLSDSFWRRRFGGDPRVIGQSLTMSGQRYLIVGVMPRDFAFPLHLPSDVWQPVTGWGGFWLDRSQRAVQSVARLAPGVSLERARAEVHELSERLAADYPDTNDGWSMRLTPLVDQVLGGYREAFGALLGAVALLLLIGCVNIAGVFLARNTTRRHEMAVRVAVGAGRGRIALEVMTESLILALVGGLLGSVLGYAGAQVLSGFLPRFTPRLGEIRPELPVVAFAVAATGLTALLPTKAASLLASLDVESGEAGRQALEGARKTLATFTDPQSRFDLLFWASPLSTRRRDSPRSLLWSSFSSPVATWPCSF